jgi:hypothetical protein
MPDPSALPDAPLLFESASPSDGMSLAVCASCNGPYPIAGVPIDGELAT